MAPKAVVVEATTFILSGQPSGVGPSVVTVTRLGSDMGCQAHFALRGMECCSCRVQPLGSTLPMVDAPFAAGVVEKLEKRDNHAVVQDRKGRREPRGRKQKGCQPPRPQGTNGLAGKDVRRSSPGGAEGDGIGGEGLAQGGVWDDALPDPPAQRSSASVREAQPGTSPFQEAILSICCRS